MGIYIYVFVFVLCFKQETGQTTRCILAFIQKKEKEKLSISLRAIRRHHETTG
jgi:hypothetical protein